MTDFRHPKKIVVMDFFNYQNLLKMTNILPKAIFVVGHTKKRSLSMKRDLKRDFSSICLPSSFEG